MELPARVTHAPCAIPPLREALEDDMAPQEINPPNATPLLKRVSVTPKLRV